MFLDTKYYTSIPIFVLFVLSFGISNAEQAPNIIGEYNNWTALTYKERGKIVCFMSPKHLSLRRPAFMRLPLILMIA